MPHVGSSPTPSSKKDTEKEKFLMYARSSVDKSEPFLPARSGVRIPSGVPILGESHGDEELHPYGGTRSGS